MQAVRHRVTKVAPASRPLLSFLLPAFAQETASSPACHFSSSARARRRVGRGAGQRSSPVLSDIQSQFSFTRAPPPALDLEKPKVDLLLLLCDQAIHLSRDSSNPGEIARSKLKRAARIFFNIIKAAHDKGQDVDMGYEIFLLRSGWIQVVRTILALVGKEAAHICALMMNDYLQWEKRLSMCGVETKDGTEVLPTAQAEGKGIDKMEEERYFYGPFVQDSAPVLHDLFWYLTTSSVKVGSVRSRRVGHTRAYTSKAHFQTALQLWKSICEIPSGAWKKPMCADWLRLCDRTPYKDGQELIGLCMVLHGRALLTRGKLKHCVQLWKDGVGVCTGDSERYLRSLMVEISTSLRTTRWALDRGLQHERLNMPGAVVSASEYFDTLNAFAKLLARGGVQVETQDGRTTNVMPARMDDILRNLLSVDRVVQSSGRLKEDDKTEERIAKLANSTSHLLRDWVKDWFDDEKEGVRMPSPLHISTCNNLLHRLLFGSPGFAPSSPLAMRLVENMIKDPALPDPNAFSNSIMVRSAKLNRMDQMGLAVMQLAHHQASNARSMEAVGSKEERGNGMVGDEVKEEASGKTAAPLPLPPILSLLDDALGRSDVYQLVALLKSAKTDRSFSSAPRKLTRSIARYRLSHFMGASIGQVVFFLYPSLDLKGRQRRLDLGEIPHVSRRDPHRNASAFHPSVLVAVLNLVATAGKTGLAERVWRMIKRASLRFTEAQQQDPTEQRGWAIPIQAYTIMMRLYASEVRRSTAAANRRHSVISRSSSSAGARRVSHSSGIAHGWGYIRSGPNRDTTVQSRLMDRSVVARACARREYRELQSRWEEGRAAPADGLFYLSLLAVFRKGGNTSGDLDIANDADAAFLRALREDLDPSMYPPPPQ